MEKTEKFTVVFYNCIKVVAFFCLPQIVDNPRLRMYELWNLIKNVVVFWFPYSNDFRI